MKALLMVLVALSLAACGDEDKTGTEGTPSNDRSATSTDDANPPLTQMAVDRPDTIVRRGAPLAMAVALDPLGALALSGQVEVAGKGEASSFAVRLAGGSSHASYEGAIRLGSCSRMGASVASLNPATADSLGSARAQTDVPIRMDSLVATPMVVVYGVGGRPATCGPLPSIARSP